MATQIEVTQIRSGIGRPANQRVIVKSLGLRHVGHTVRLKDTPAARGMVTKIQHLLEVRVLEGEAPAFGRRSRNK